MRRFALGRVREAFFDPLTRLHLVRPHQVAGEVPDDADFRNIERALKSGGLVELTGNAEPPADETLPLNFPREELPEVTEELEPEEPKRPKARKKK